MNVSFGSLAVAIGGRVREAKVDVVLAVVDVAVPVTDLVGDGVGTIRPPVPVGRIKVAVRVSCVLGAAFDTPTHML